MRFSISGLASLTVVITTVQAGGFLVACDIPSLESGLVNAGVLTTACQNSKGHFVVTSIDLNACLTNVSGKLSVSISPFMLLYH